MNYYYNCYKIRSIFNFIVSTILIINTKTRTFYVNIILITLFYKHHKIKIIYSHKFWKFLFNDEQKFYYDAKFEIYWENFHNVFLKQTI